MYTLASEGPKIPTEVSDFSILGCIPSQKPKFKCCGSELGSFNGKIPIVYQNGAARLCMVKDTVLEVGEIHKGLHCLL